ncbi:unnamed protein product, partial [Lymnaea stagnalis]
PDCSVAQEKLALGSNEIIAVAVSVGLAAVILAVVLTLAVVLCARRGKRVEYFDNNSRPTTSQLEDKTSLWSSRAPIRVYNQTPYDNIAHNTTSLTTQGRPDGVTGNLENQGLSPDYHSPWYEEAPNKGEHGVLRLGHSGRGPPLAYNPATIWPNRFSYWSDEGRDSPL